MITHEEGWMQRFEGDSITVLCARIIELEAELDEVRTNYHNDQVKWEKTNKYRDSPSAFGAAIETYVLLQDEWHEHYTDEGYNELKKLTEDEYYRFCASCGEEDGFWSDDATQDCAEQMHIKFIEANVKNLKAEGGVKGLRKRWREEKTNSTTCEHIHYRETLTGAECIDCGLEHEEVSE